VRIYLQKINARNAKYVIDHLDLESNTAMQIKKLAWLLGQFRKVTLLMLDINLVVIPNGSKKRLVVQTF